MRHKKKEKFEDFNIVRIQQLKKKYLELLAITNSKDYISIIDSQNKSRKLVSKLPTVPQNTSILQSI